MPLAPPPPRISDSDYVFAYPLLALWAITFGVLTPSALDLGVFRLVNAILMLLVAVCAVVAWHSVLVRTTLTVERIAVWGALAGIVFYGVLQAGLAGYYIVTVSNTDRVALVLFAAYTAVLTNRRRRWLDKQRRQVSLIAAAHPEEDR